MVAKMKEVEEVLNQIEHYFDKIEVIGIKKLSNVLRLILQVPKGFFGKINFSYYDKAFLIKFNQKFPNIQVKDEYGRLNTIWGLSDDYKGLFHYEFCDIYFLNIQNPLTDYEALYQFFRENYIMIQIQRY